ncbi:MAG: ABC transporter permease [Gemmatimonadetes bacterium]|nr:ABC transporter permease [Gemmatimonadota bacterium]
MNALLHDVRYGARKLFTNPGLTAVAVLTLALGIGAGTAMFTVVNSVLLRPLAYTDPERLVMVWERTPTLERNYVSPADYSAWRARAESFAELAASSEWPQTLTGDGPAEEVTSMLTTLNYFATLQADARLGRTYRPGDPGEGVAVLSHAFWQRRFGGDPAVVGRAITINGSPVTVLGVMPEGFRAPGARMDLWMPVELDPGWRGRYLQVVGRLRPDVTLARAQAEMEAISRQLAKEQPRSNRGRVATLLPVHEQVTGGVRPALLVLLGAVGLLLLIACANVANLLLGRAAARSREMALRLALGATRGRLVRQALVESVLLAGIAGVLGLLLAVWGTEALVRLLPGELPLPRLEEVRVDGRVLGFALASTLLTGIAFGTAPAVLGSSVKLSHALRQGGGGALGGRGGLRHAFVLVQVALTVILLAGAGLLGRSLRNILAVDTGVETRGVLTLRMRLASARYGDEAALRGFVDRLLPRLRELPGVGAVGADMYLPLMDAKMAHGFYREDRPPAEHASGLAADFRVVAGDYFAALGIPLLRGRAFAPSDTGGAHVAVVNQEMARRYFPGEDPVGRRIGHTWGSDTVSARIVGIVGDVRETGPTRPPAPAIYRPFAQAPSRRLAFVIRAAGDAGALAAPAAAAVREVDPDQAVGAVRTMDEILGDNVARPRITLVVLASFAGMALLLAALGLYGTVSYSVAQRRQEIGLRMAVGADPHEVLGRILGQGMRLTLLGIAIGLAASLFLTRVMASLLFGVRAVEPATLAGVALFTAAVALLATYLPARRAARMDPTAALRAE